MATSGALQTHPIKTTYLKHKTLHNPAVCIMDQGLAKTGGIAEDTRADEKSGTELESDGAPELHTGSAQGLSSKRQNPWNLIFQKFGSCETDNAISALRKSRDTCFDTRAKEHCKLDYCFLVQLHRAEVDSVFKENTQSQYQL